VGFTQPFFITPRDGPKLREYRAQPCITPSGTISTSATFSSTLREPTAKPPQPGPFSPPSGLAVLCRPLATWPSMNAVPPPETM